MKFRRPLTALSAILLLAIIAQPSHAIEVLFVGGNTGANAGADSMVFSHLKRLQNVNVTYKRASTAVTGDAAGFDVVMTSSTPGSGDIRNKFQNISQGLINWEEAVADDGAGEFAFADSITKENNQTQLTVNSGSLSGLTTFTNHQREYTGGNGLGAGVVDVATTNGGRPGIMHLAAGALDQNGVAAPGNRVNLPMSDSTFNAISQDGLTLFNESLAFAAGSGPITTAPANVIWYSKLDGNATAIVGTDGFVGEGSPTASNDRFGNSGAATFFDGNDSFHIAPEVPSLQQGSISLWVNNTATDGAERGAIGVGASGGGSDQYFTLMRQNQSGGLDNYRSDLDGGNVIGFAREDVAVSGLTRDWHHVTMTFDLDAQELIMYIDGEIVNQEDLPTASGPLSPSNIWMIGAERIGSRFFMGDIDDVAIWGDVLNPGEVFALANDLLTVEEVAGLADVPEPTTAALGLLGMAGLLGRRRRAA